MWYWITHIEVSWRITRSLAFFGKINHIPFDREKRLTICKRNWIICIKLNTANVARYSHHVFVYIDRNLRLNAERYRFILQLWTFWMSICKSNLYSLNVLLSMSLFLFTQNKNSFQSVLTSKHSLYWTFVQWHGVWHSLGQ